MSINNLKKYYKVKFKYYMDKFNRFKMAATVFEIIAGFPILNYLFLLSQTENNKIGIYVNINNMQIRIVYFRIIQ